MPPVAIGTVLPSFARRANEVESPWARKNFVDHTLTDQSSLLRFVEDNWDLGQLEGSSDAVAGPVNALFDFEHSRGDRVFLDPVTGQARDGEGGDGGNDD